MSLEIPGRGAGGCLEANSLEAKCEAKLKFPGRREGGCKTKNLQWGCMDIFWNCTIGQIHTTDSKSLFGKSDSLSASFSSYIFHNLRDSDIYFNRCIE